MASSRLWASLSSLGRSVAGGPHAWARWGVGLAGGLLVLVLLPALGLARGVYFDRNELPDLEPFLRFAPPTTGEVRDSRGEVLIQVAREYRQVVSYDEVPPIVRQAILAAEDKNFLTHSGLDYGALPRIVGKSIVSSWTRWRKAGSGFRLMLPQGGSTLTQQLVRGFFLPDLMRCEGGDVLCNKGPASKVLAAVVGVSNANRLLRKREEARLSLWLEEEMRRRYGSRDAKREIFARYASFVYLGHGRYGFAAASEFYFGRPLSSYTADDAGEAALLAGIAKSPEVYAPAADDPRPLRRRNQTLALMARNGFIPESLAERAQAEPVVVVDRSRVETRAPAVIGHVFAELKQVGGTRFGLEDLFQGRISVQSTVDVRVQTIVNEALESGLALYEKRHLEAAGRVQGSVVLLRNADAAILAEAGGRSVFGGRPARYSDYNRVTDSLRQPGSAWKPLVYLTAFRRGMDLESIVPDDPFGLRQGNDRGVKWIRNFGDRFKGPIPVRVALAESRNAAAVWVACEIGLREVNRTARELGIHSPLRPYAATALGASEVRLLELAGAYRAIASGIAADPHIVARVTDASGDVVHYEAPPPAGEVRRAGLGLIQEGMRGVVRLPEGTAHGLDDRSFAIPVMGKTGSTNAFRDALFVGSTYGAEGVTVAVRIGFDDNRSLGPRETGARVALPIFREIMLRVYEDELLGPVPRFPRKIERGIDAYLAARAQEARREAEAALQELPPASDDDESLSAAAPVSPETVLQCSG